MEEYVKISVEKYEKLREIEKVHAEAIARARKFTWGSGWEIDILTDKEDVVKLIVDGKKEYELVIQVLKTKITSLEEEVKKAKSWW